MFLHPAALPEIVSGFSTILGMLINELEKNGALGSFDIAQALRASADHAEQTAPESMKGNPRLDLQIVRTMASIVEGHRQGVTLKPWQPVVIEGGLQNPKQEDD